ncbi:MAG: arginyltransferase, partial [Planctomycetaceae bacterium]
MTDADAAKCRAPALDKPQVIDRFRFITEPAVCPYVASETSRLEYRIPWQLQKQGYGELVRRGWRRFGNHIFRPQCPVCSQCRSLRVLTNGFEPSKSLRRVLRKNSGVHIEIGAPTVSVERIALFNQWHADMARRRGWPETTTTTQDYYDSFIGEQFEFAHEFRYLIDGQLVGISLVDLVATGVSSVYFYHDPAWRSCAPGTFSILQEIDWAGQLNLPYVYLGYWIQQNPSMDYKA